MDAFVRKDNFFNQLLKIADADFEQLNHEIIGIPVYYNGTRVWPQPQTGFEVVFTRSSSILTD